MNETKALKAEICQLKAVGDDENMLVEGYGAVFGNVDAYGDVIVPGAFTKTLIDNPKPKMLWQHDAAEVIGVWEEIKEDNYGLYMRGRILDTTRGSDAHKLLKAGALDGMSIGFRLVEWAQRSKPEDPKRTIKSVDLLEVSLVTFPANGKARVTYVKSADTIQTIRDLEDALRERGFSKSEALAIVSRFECKAELDERNAAEELRCAANRMMTLLKAS
jgi:uncharacterized protein